MTRWRSLLFVPANASAQRLENAHQRGSDAIVLDLEDAVAPDAKAAAREGIPAIIANLAGRGPDILVRVNTAPDAVAADLRAAIRPGVLAVAVPKVEDPAQLVTAGSLIGALEAERGLPPLQIGMVAMIESPAGLARVAEIAAADRVVAVALGGEDFSLCMGVPPGPANLTLPCQMIALAASLRGIMAIGLPASVAAYDDLDAYAASARFARAMGLTGALCIHPTQVPVINAAFSPSPEECARAERIVAAWEAAETRGETVFALDGRMIDWPIVLRARALVADVKRNEQAMSKR
jgi:citrate lyase subunit beta/citryl-CoA lyase